MLQVYQAAKQLHSAGIATFAVGVGSMTSTLRLEELRQITSGPPEYDDNVFLVSRYKYFLPFVFILRNAF